MRLTARRPRASGFTLIELLVVMSIIAALAGLLFPVAGGVQITVRKLQTKTLLATMKMGIDMYYNEYQRLPQLTGAAGADLAFKSNDTAGKELIAALTGSIDNPESQRLNPKGIAFCQFSPKRLRETDAQGEGGYLVDAFNNPIYIILDYNYDGKIDNANLGELASKFRPKGDIRANFAAWSQGPAKQVSDMTQSDLIATWK
jgi:prepilin-type N-terminal cleavage/methylation domain-containing protein